MTIKPPPSHVPQDLFPAEEIASISSRQIKRPGEARVIYGGIVNTVVNALLGLEDIPNSGSHDVVFDSFLRGRNTFVEVKSLRRGDKIPIYQWRIEKDRQAGVPLLYVIGIHNCTKQATLAGVWNRMAETMDRILVLPAAEIERLAEDEPLQQIKTGKTASGERNGYQRAGYRDGYKNIPWDKLLGCCGFYDRIVTGRVHGLGFRAIVNFHLEVKPWL